MKCRAAEERQETRLQEITRLYGVKCMAAIQSETALLLCGAYPWFRVGGRETDHLKEFFDGQAAICEHELNENAPDFVRVKDRRGWHEGDRVDLFEETVNDAAYKLARDLKDAGIDADRVYDAADAAVPEKLFLGSDLIHKDARLAWYGWLGRRAIRVWISASGLSLLRFRYPSGRRRFAIVSVESEILLPLAGFASGWVTRFIGGRDRERDREQDARMKRLRDEYNVEMLPVRITEENELSAFDLKPTVTEKRPEIKPEIAPGFAPDARFEAILGERRGFGDGIAARMLK